MSRVIDFATRVSSDNVSTSVFDNQLSRSVLQQEIDVRTGGSSTVANVEQALMRKTDCRGHPIFDGENS